MARKLVKFLAGYSRYNKGETAAFDAGHARKLCAGPSPAAIMVGDATEPAKRAVAQVQVDVAGEVHSEIADAERRMKSAFSELDERQGELTQQAADNDQRAADLDAREAALKKAEAAAPKAKEDGEPPVQGSKK
ncbi:hypothetical protein KL867_17715 [Ruegeria litorea]|uniref:Uncharacterized protein n=1 Tax=Falsiruegeria litorea TaxID=1280831 RepID=A0ABS5WUT9_9RHOB|nr:hypothetical protein [Falsiruegeria litorea]MBT3142910.1 hypothetical protein [Falsiruegeria litorea]